MGGERNGFSPGKVDMTHEELICKLREYVLVLSIVTDGSRSDRDYMAIMTASADAIEALIAPAPKAETMAKVRHTAKAEIPWYLGDHKLSDLAGTADLEAYNDI